MRYDQFMKFGWKVLIPSSIAWILIVSVARYLRNEGNLDSRTLLVAAGVILLIGVGISYALEVRKARRDELEAEQARIEEGKPFDAFAGGFPVPPMPGQEGLVVSRHVPVTVPAPGINAGEDQ
jgi:NADH-quinone oxidoreductase subunit H